MKFKQWFLAQETMTDTGCIASFKMPIGSMGRRLWPMDWKDWEKKRKKGSKEQPQVKEGKSEA